MYVPCMYHIFVQREFVQDSSPGYGLSRLPACAWQDVRGVAVGRLASRDDWNVRKRVWRNVRQKPMQIAKYCIIHWYNIEHHRTSTFNKVYNCRNNLKQKSPFLILLWEFDLWSEVFNHFKTGHGYYLCLCDLRYICYEAIIRPKITSPEEKSLPIEIQ